MAAPANMNPPGKRRIYMKSIDFLATKARVEHIMTSTLCRTLKAHLRDTLKDTFSNNRDIYTLRRLRCTWGTLKYHWGDNDTLSDTWRNIRNIKIPSMYMT